MRILVKIMLIGLVLSANFACNTEFSNRDKNYSIAFSERVFSLPDSVYYPTDFTISDGQYFFLDSKGGKILAFNREKKGIHIWRIYDYLHDEKYPFDQIFDYDEFHIFLYSSISKKAIKLKKNFSDYQVFNFSSFNEEIFFPSNGSLVIWEAELVTFALEQSNKGRHLKIVSLNLDSYEVKDIVRFDQVIGINIPLMFFRPALIESESKFNIYFPTVDKSISIVSQKNQQSNLDIINSRLLEIFDVSKFNENPFYAFEFQFYYYTISLPGRIVRLKNNDFVRDKLKANVEMLFFNSLNELEAIHELSVQFFHKKAFGFQDSGYFLLSDLTGRNEDFIYLIEFNLELFKSN
ncbi:hypothetical protein [Algoriphagus namhaensis]